MSATNAAPCIVTKIFYISTGRKSGFYTLRSLNVVVGSNFEPPDNHVCTLTASEDTSIEKAERYVEAFRARVPETQFFKINLDTSIEREVIQRMGKLSVRDTQHIQLVEAGIMPIGKHQGKVIAELPSGSILWYADNSKNVNGPVMGAICDYCTGVAAERGYFQVREVQRDEYAKLNSLSVYVGELKQRMDLTGELFFQKENGGYFIGTEFVEPYWLQKVRCDGNVVVYSGSKKLGNIGEILTFRATVKRHDEYQGVKQTVVNRPSVLSNEQKKVKL